MAWTKSLAAAAALLLLAIPLARAADLVVYHNWQSPGELAALNVLRAAIERRGDRWIPLSIPHDLDGDMNVLGLIAAGASPNIFLQMQPPIYRRLAADGRLLPLDEQFAANGLLAHLPPVVRDAITIDGTILKVPATIHADATIYYNVAVADAAGIAPQGWTSLDDMWADFPAVRAAGYRPIAIGAQPWQLGYLTHALVAAIGGAPLYDAIYGVEPNPAALDDRALLDVFVWLRRFQQEADPGATGRDWNMATAMVIGGEALLQVQGDWMKGEWRAAGKVPDVDFGCLILPGAAALPITVDSWGLMGAVSAETEAAERAFADAMVDPQIQAAFAAAKGATPVRSDARGAIDDCSRRVLTAMDTPGFAVLTPHLVTPPDRLAAIWAVADRFWNDQTMSPADAVADLREAFLATDG